MSISNLIVSAEHAFAVAAKDTVAVAKFVEQKVLPELVKAQASAGQIEAITSLVSRQAANIERVGFAVLGVVIKAIQDAGAAGAAGGLSVSLDAQLVSDIRQIVPAVQAQAVLTTAAAPKVA